MKAGNRKFHKDATIKNIEGQEHEFKKGDVIEVSILDRREGLCKITAAEVAFKNKVIKGSTTLIS